MGIRQVEAGDLEDAVITLDGALRGLASAQDRATAHLYLAMSFVGLDQMDRAEANVRHARQLDPARALDPNRYPPPILRLFAQAGGETVQRPEAAREAVRLPQEGQTPEATAASAEQKQKGGSRLGGLLLGGAVVAAVGAAAVWVLRADEPGALLAGAWGGHTTLHTECGTATAEDRAQLTQTGTSVSGAWHSEILSVSSDASECRRWIGSIMSDRISGSTDGNAFTLSGPNSALHGSLHDGTLSGTVTILSSTTEGTFVWRRVHYIED